MGKKMAEGIKHLVKQGEFASQAEYIRHLVRHDLSSKLIDEQLEAELIASLDSGPAKPIDWKLLRNELKKVQQEKHTCV